MASLAGTAVLLTGCSEDGKASGGDSAGGGGDSAMVTVEYEVTGDSPASVYSPGVKSESYTGTKSGDGQSDLEAEGVTTPWSKKFEVRPGRSLTLQVSSEEPRKEIGCRILVNGKVVDERTKRNDPGSTLNTTCSGTTPR
ncbi:MmpS family transport accessory protein [Streptomyces oceani]|uniref:MmpS family membrane protein n=1 Tax=Streptomyces oceani TaxID=1075402 RepID=A0A1E7JWY8_9ACTN|nr:MmpS family transport accessory protein [Streptomyces oceani]OEU96183.1 hypothetical protein AN216_21815 [Streptomyces oceani]